MRSLGIDYGTKRVGLSLSDEEGMMAFPKVVLKNSDLLMNEILQTCNEEDVKEVVIGESKNLDGTPNPLMKHIEVFVEEWKKRSEIPIFLEPEFLTSHQAQKIQGKNDMLDASAATIILQSYLDRKQYKESKTTNLHTGLLPDRDCG